MNWSQKAWLEIPILPLISQVSANHFPVTLNPLWNKRGVNNKKINMLHPLKKSFLLHKLDVTYSCLVKTK